MQAILFPPSVNSDSDGKMAALGNVAETVGKATGYETALLAA